MRYKYCDCEIVQGDLYARPAPFSQLCALLNSGALKTNSGGRRPYEGPWQGCNSHECDAWIIPLGNRKDAFAPRRH